MILIKYILAIFSILVCLSVYADDNIISLAKETLKLNENSNDFFVKKVVSAKFADIKDFIQADLKNGNKRAQIDIFLLLDGLVQDNLLSLQSFLVTSNKDVLSNDLSEYISYNYAEKLSYALKENKRLLNTNYSIVNNKKNIKCVNYLNGFKISNNNFFIAPAGLIYYVASYCEDNTFSVKEIQSENAQANYVIDFQDYQVNNYNENINKMKILNPNSSFSSESTSQQILPKEGTSKNGKISGQTVQNNEHLAEEKNEFLISTGIGYNYFPGILKNENISNFGMGYGALIYSNSAFHYGNWFFALDIANINRDLIQYQDVLTISDSGTSSKSTIKSIQNQNGYFIRPNLGLQKYLYKFSDKVLILGSIYTTLTFIKTQGNDSYSNIIPGLGVSPAIQYLLADNYSINLNFNFGLDFTSDETQLVLGPVLSFGFTF